MTRGTCPPPGSRSGERRSVVRSHQPGRAVEGLPEAGAIEGEGRHVDAEGVPVGLGAVTASVSVQPNQGANLKPWATPSPASTLA